MTMQELGSLGEILGAIAVLGTLVYLAVQTRHTRLAVENAGNAMAVEAHSRSRVALMENPELADVLAKANHGEGLTDGERLQAQAFFNEVFIACVMGQVTESKGAPRTDVQYLMDFFERIPSGIDEWKRQSHMIGPLVPDYCAEIDRLLAERVEPE